jgi:hypothetical protein
VIDHDDGKRAGARRLEDRGFELGVEDDPFLRDGEDSSSACAPVPMRRARAPARKAPVVARTEIVDEVPKDFGMDEFSSLARFAYSVPGLSSERSPT